MWRPLNLEAWNSKRRENLDSVEPSVSEIIDHVRNEGDKALFDLAERFDKVKLKALRVDEEQLKAARESIEPALVSALQEARKRIERFHRMQLKDQTWLKEVEPGIALGVRVTPLERIGAYIPGGRASYPSTALMCVIPAKVAGVEEIVCCTPPPANPLTLAALEIAGADEVYLVGGAQAVAAMALGTKSIRRVQKIVGPGNIYVTAAKMMLRDHVEIDFPAGPSEIVIVADSSANPEFIAADILAQAEHDPKSPCALVTTDPDLPKKVGDALRRQLKGSKRQEILLKSMDNAGYLVVKGIHEAGEVVNRIAPEHLSVQCSDPVSFLDEVQNAGSIFLGHYAAVACGDYASGTNHVLPTAGFASLYSGLDVWHFCKRTSVQMIERRGLEEIGDMVERLAKAEGLEAHARSVSLRRKSKQGG